MTRPMNALDLAKMHLADRERADKAEVRIAKALDIISKVDAYESSSAWRVLHDIEEALGSDSVSGARKDDDGRSRNESDVHVSLPDVLGGKAARVRVRDALRPADAQHSEARIETATEAAPVVPCPSEAVLPCGHDAKHGHTETTCDVCEAVVGTPRTKEAQREPNFECPYHGRQLGIVVPGGWQCPACNAANAQRANEATLEGWGPKTAYEAGPWAGAPRPDSALTNRQRAEKFAAYWDVDPGHEMVDSLVELLDGLPRPEPPKASADPHGEKWCADCGDIRWCCKASHDRAMHLSETAEGLTQENAEQCYRNGYLAALQACALLADKDMCWGTASRIRAMATGGGANA